jgi:hypothetical protein
MWKLSISAYLWGILFALGFNRNRIGAGRQEVCIIKQDCIIKQSWTNNGLLDNYMNSDSARWTQRSLLSLEVTISLP